MQDILGFIETYGDLADYFPDLCDIPKCGKEWVVNMCQTLKPDEFNAFVRQKEKARRAKMD